MGVDLVPFADNWAYLKTELAWLDRLLMLAIARQRKDTQAVNKVANTPADRLSNHWWKGVISVPNPNYDDCRVPQPAATETQKTTSSADTETVPACKKAPVGYQSQLEARIKVSAEDNIVLALPSLRHYLNLSLFEKNLLLLVLAPEVNRRYGRLYHYLQTGEEKGNSDLPMVDLALRLLCRNDLERRRARAKLTGPDSLVEKKILRYVALRPGTRLTSYLQMSEAWVNYLLSEQPDQQFLFEQLATPEPLLALPAPTPATRAVKIRQPEVSWDQLILPTPTLRQLQTLSQQTSASFVSHSNVGHLAILVGETGTGKTMAAGAIATSLRQSLSELDLAQVYSEHWLDVLASLDSARYPVLLVKSAAVWFGRNRDNGEQANRPSKAQLQQWLHARQTEAGITLLSTRYLHTVQARWRQQIENTITLPMPYKVARKMLWRQAFSGITCSSKIDWIELAAQLKVSGGEIQQLAESAVAIAQNKNAKTIKLSHIQQAIKQRGLSTVID
ncbi:MAG: AAA family ATPase [Cyanobacteria bacterium J06598_1]